LFGYFFHSNDNCLLRLFAIDFNNQSTKITVLNRIKKNDFSDLTQSFSYWVYLSLAMAIVAFAFVAKFHSLEDNRMPASLYTLKAAVLGPEVP